MRRNAFAFILLICVSASLSAEPLVIPRIDEKVTLEDFASMLPRPELLNKLAVIDQFVQTDPSDGAPPTQKTVVYIAYDQSNLYVIFVCFDSEPHRIASSISRREGFSGDEDWIEFYLDTFNDQRRAYCFSTNPHGVQWDSRYSETSGARGLQGHQPSFDILWYSDGKLTDQGYIVSITVPFKSIRFPSRDLQTWRILFGRSIPRNNEYVAWPHISRSIQGYLTQSSELTGMQNISPGKSLQFIPYSTVRSFRLLDLESETPGFVSESMDASAGLDAKLVLKDSFVFDMALNPDFSQVESDEPQVTVNQRFEVFFPEKRPFFLENAQYFETPMNLVFTRRIADPQFGGRFTGKQGPYTLGFLYANDEAPGKVVDETDPVFGSNANFGVVRFTRDLLSQSSVGVLFTSRTFEGTDNSVLGSDFRFRMGDHWEAAGQAVWSRNELLDGSSDDGSAYFAQARRSGRQFQFNMEYEDLSPEFQTLTGFIPRVDYRSLDTFAEYRWRPAGKILEAWGPDLEVLEAWDHEGTRLDSMIAPALELELQRGTRIYLRYSDIRETIRPEDFPELTENVEFHLPLWRLFFETSYWTWGTIRTTFQTGKQTNFEPPVGQIPSREDHRFIEIYAVVRPLRRLQLENSYLFTELKSPEKGRIFDDHIVSIRGNYQFTRALSLRVILQYDHTTVNETLTSLENRRNLNADFLITYLLNPWTALYVGYNGNRQNLIFPVAGEPPFVRTRDRLINDANQFFLKFSYLFRL